MKKVILMVLFGLSLVTNSFGQNYPKISDNGDTILLSQNVKYYVAQKIKIGAGTSDGGDFKYIKINQAGFTAVMSTTNNRRYNRDMFALDPSFSGRLGEVKKIKAIGSDKRGYNYEILLSIDGIHRHQCDIINAIKFGEIECDTCGSLKPSSQQQVIINNNAPSVTDELVKLKKLKDEGIITEEEFQDQKKKLLSK
jgi:hypothetical protein